jgi:Domain of unknown function (DUF4440)
MRSACRRCERCCRLPPDDTAMKELLHLAVVLLLVVGSVLGIARAVENPSASPAAAPDALHATIAKLDAAAFDAFNRCDQPGELAKHAAFFAKDVEFYHDTGGVTFTRGAMLANTKKYVCGNFSRELIPGSLVVHPIKDFGALAQGSHRFCQFKSGQCEGLADFSILWRLQKGKWQITRVLSYGHRAAETAPRPD